MQLSYKKIGEGPALVILHGLYGSSDNWMTIGRAFSKNYTVFIPDLRNHGKSPHIKDHTYKLLVDDLLEFFCFHKISNAIIIGHSMGGKLAMLFSLTNPEFVKSLIIVDIAPKRYTLLQDLSRQIIQHLNIINAYLSVDLTGKETRDEVEVEFSNYIKDTKERQFLLKNLVRDGKGFRWAINVKAISNALPEIMDGPDFEKTQSNSNTVTFPTLFVKGEKSDYLQEIDLGPIKKLFPHSDMVTIPGAGHWVHAEQPVQFIDAINNFLK
jgi:esterase